MGHERHFLGWHAPITTLVSDYLLPDVPTGPVDFDGTLIVVPTRQAGRRLRETMARRCADSGSTLLSARVVTPHFFLTPTACELPAASASLVLSAWVDVVQGLDPDGFPALFPSFSRERDFGWALSQAELIQGLRKTTSDGGWSLAAIIDKVGVQLEEYERWRELAELESRYLERLGAWGVADPCQLQLAAAKEPERPDRVERVVVAGVPDPSLLALSALRELAGRTDVVVLVHAPSELRDGFDEWGRPIYKCWCNRLLAIPRAEETVLAAASPDAQARTILKILSTHEPAYGPLDVAIGVPDRAVASHVATRLGEVGITAAEPADMPVSSHALFHLVDSVAQLALSGDYRAVAACLRQPAVLECLAGKQGGDASGPLDAGSLLTQLDRFQNQYLPVDVGDIKRLLGKREVLRAYPQLVPAIEAVVRWQDLLNEGSPAAGLREILIELLERRSVSSLNARDRELAEVAQVVSDTLRECESLHALHPRSVRDELRLFLRRLKQAHFTPVRADPMIDLEGWLELPWNDAPLMLVTGMNEGVVPDSRMSDVFLPDSMRRLLGLRDDRMRFARDRYLMESLIECRSTRGTCYFLSGQTSAQGDPLKPSRLLFCCSDSELPRRAKTLFGPTEEGRQTVASTVGFKLQPWFEMAPVEKLSATALRQYLACPFRFYLGHVLGMEALSDEKRELDALDFGNLVHGALEELGRDLEIRASVDEEAIADLLCGYIDRVGRERYGDHPAVAVRVALDSARQRLHAAAGHLVQLNREGWRTVAVEQKGEIRIGNLRIRGKLDRIDFHPGSRKWRIIDYKSSDRATSPRDAHLAAARSEEDAWRAVTVGKKCFRWVDLQLPLYVAMLPMLDGVGEVDIDSVELAYFNLPRAVLECGLQVWEDFSSAVQQSAIDVTREVLRRIKQGVFWPPADKVAYDDYETIFPAGIRLSVVDAAGEGRDA